MESPNGKQCLYQNVFRLIPGLFGHVVRALLPNSVFLAGRSPLCTYWEVNGLERLLLFTP